MLSDDQLMALIPEPQPEILVGRGEKVWRCEPVERDQRVRVESEDAVASSWPEGEKQREEGEPRCEVRV